MYGEGKYRFYFKTLNSQLVCWNWLSEAASKAQILLKYKNNLKVTEILYIYSVKKFKNPFLKSSFKK